MTDEQRASETIIKGNDLPVASKRSFLKRSGLMAIGFSNIAILGLVGGQPAMAQGNSQSTRTTHLLELMKKGDDAFNNRDFAGMDAVHHPNMIAHITGNPEPLYGREAHAVAMSHFFEVFPDVHIENDPYPVQFGSGDWITVVSRTTGTFTGQIALPDGTIIAGNGRTFDVEFGQTSRWEGDLLAEISAFWDANSLARQIGLA